MNPPLTRLVAALLLWSCQSVQAQFSPGELTKGHAALEGIHNCTQCHDVGQRLDGSKCLACHLELKNRVDQKKGLHATAAVRGKECVACHFDHKGKDFDIVYWEHGKERFDHELAGYSLIGKHKTDRCDKCHKPDHIVDKTVRRQAGVSVDLTKTFLGLSTECQTCHFDEHRGQLGNDCAKCHDFEDWKQSATVRFRHDSTAYPLTGLHESVACVKCHNLVVDPRKKPDGRMDPNHALYKPIAHGNCTACHRDVHENRFGQTCQSCHTTFGWFIITARDFDHGKTRYPLSGRHASVPCESCHQPDPKKTPIYQQMAFEKCADCHKDIHAGQFSERPDHGACESCHDVNGFVPSLFTIARHNTESRYALSGSHAHVVCGKCHPSEPAARFHETSGYRTSADSALVFKMKSQRCAGCHTDIHRGQFADKIKDRDCAACHTTTSWKELTFNHNTDAVFPLAGKHKDAACVRCHPVADSATVSQRVIYKPLPSACESCHKDIHEGQFARDVSKDRKQSACQECHSNDGWKPSTFDHVRQSRFPLTGAHVRVECRKCHPQARLHADTLTVLYKPLGTDCASCHKDIHEGAFEL